MDQKAKEIRLVRWIPVVQACQSSGQSVRTWCAEHQVSEKQYYYWQRLVRRAAAEQLPA